MIGQVDWGANYIVNYDNATVFEGMDPSSSDYNLIVYTYLYSFDPSFLQGQIGLADTFLCSGS